MFSISRQALFFLVAAVICTVKAEDFTLCGASVAVPNNPQGVKDDQCSVCTEGVSWWPCVPAGLCKCLPKNDPSIPPPFPWQVLRKDVISALITVFQKESPLKVGNKGICGILGNIAGESAYSFDYTTKEGGGKGNGYGLFQFDAMKAPYYQYLTYKGLKDSAESQVRFVEAMSNPAFDWSSTPMKENPTGANWGQKIHDALVDASLSAEDQAEKFMNYFERPSSPTPVPRRASARHCYFEFGDEPITTVTNIVTTAVTKSDTTAVTNTVSTESPKGSGIFDLKWQFLSFLCVTVFILAFVA